MISNKMRRQNMVPQSPPKLQRPADIQDSVTNENLRNEENTEGTSESSPAFNPTSPGFTSETTESAEGSRVRGPGTSLDFSSIREPEPAVEIDSTVNSDMSMFTALIIMNSAQIPSSKWMIDSGAQIT